MESGALDADGDVTQPTAAAGSAREVVGKESMEIEESVAVEADFIGCADQELDCVLVVQIICASRCARPMASSPSSMRRFRVEERVGVAFEAAGIPRKIDQQPATESVWRKYPQAALQSVDGRLRPDACGPVRPGRRKCSADSGREIGDRSRPVCEPPVPAGRSHGSQSQLQKAE